MTRARMRQYVGFVAARKSHPAVTRKGLDYVRNERTRNRLVSRLYAAGLLLLIAGLFQGCATVSNPICLVNCGNVRTSR